MLRTLHQTRDQSWLYRLVGIAVFTVLTIISARVSIPLEPVPFTLQPLAVVLSGMVLGWRDGLLSQALYVALIAAGLPVDAKGIGSAALVGPTAGFLIGFIGAAGAAGWLAELGSKQMWQRWSAGIVGMIVIYAVGIVVLQKVTGMDWSKAWSVGVAPFIVPDLVKALIAAALTEGGRRLMMRGSSI
ncbi:MAG: biotin transporter BioY [Anaerolineaceae bacterium]|nr:biotin transporter BioY [Anaerolineaceae bacterium]